MNITQGPIVPLPPTPNAVPGPVTVLPPRGNRWWAGGVTALSLAVLAAISIASIIPAKLVATKPVASGERQPTPYAITPATAQPVDDRISFGELGDLATQYPPEGNIYFVTVSEPPQSMLSWLVGRHEPSIQFITEEDKYGVRTPTEARRLSLASMQTSEQVAEYVALSKLGFDDVKIVAGEVLIEEFVCLKPVQDQPCTEYGQSESVLQRGDHLISVDGTKIETIDDLSAPLKGHKPGDSITVVVDRPEVGEKTFDVVLAASPDDPNRAIIGFYPFDTAHVSLPFDLKIETDQIGGPSAGLAFTLTLIDELSPGELTGDQSIAVTGTINTDGEVGPIGGLRQKASAVQQAGVRTFIVPTAQGEQDIAAARKAAPDLTIISVATLDEALAVLQKLGGDPVEPTKTD